MLNAVSVCHCFYGQWPLYGLPPFCAAVSWWRRRFLLSCEKPLCLYLCTHACVPQCEAVSLRLTPPSPSGRANRLFSQAAIPVYIPTTKQSGFRFLHPLPNPSMLLETVILMCLQYMLMWFWFWQQHAGKSAASLHCVKQHLLPTRFVHVGSERDKGGLVANLVFHKWHQDTL